MLKYILLGFLSYKPMTGYNLKQTMDTSTMHFWRAYHSQIYTTLRKMDADGLLQSETDDDTDDKLHRRVYTITPAGQAALQAWLDKPLTDLPGIKDELLVRVFFSAQRDPEHVLHELNRQREMHRQKLDLYQRFTAGKLIPDATGLERDAAFWEMTLRHGIEYETMYIRWLDETIAWVQAL